MIGVCETGKMASGPNLIAFSCFAPSFSCKTSLDWRGLLLGNVNVMETSLGSDDTGDDTFVDLLEGDISGPDDTGDDTTGEN
jgi:hypothetical protein